MVKSDPGSDEGRGHPSPRRVGLVLAGVVSAAVVVFSLGVMVGKRAAERQPVYSPPPAALPTENLEPLPLADPEAAAPEKAAPAAAPATAEEKLTFYDRLSGKEKSAPPKLSGGDDRQDAPPGAAPAPPPATTRLKAPSSREEAAGRIRVLMDKGPYLVQVSSSKKKSWADDLARRLGRLGLKATVSEVTVRGKRWYRVRLGYFADRESARRAADLCSGSLKLDAMVVKE